MEVIANYILGLITLFIIYMWYCDKKSFEKEREYAACERKDLYDRIMSPSIVEYKNNTSPEEENLKKNEDEEIDAELEEVKEALLNG